MSQLALFEELQRPQVYVPKQEHVINRLRHILAELQVAEAWPWEPVIVRLYRESTLPYLYALVTDEAQAGDWQAKIEAQLARLEAATRRDSK